MKMGDCLTSGFTQAGVYARRNICANLEVYSPQELLWNPRLRETATTLAARLADRAEDNEVENLLTPKKIE